MAVTLEILANDVARCVERTNELTVLLNSMPSRETYIEFSTLVEGEIDKLNAELADITRRVGNLEAI